MNFEERQDSIASTVCTEKSLVFSYSDVFETADLELAMSDRDGWTWLTLAASDGRLDVIKHLDSIPGIDWAANDAKGHTPLTSAAKSGQFAVK